MTDHDELLARAEDDYYGRLELLRLKDELAAALRAALNLATERLEDVRKMDDLRMAEIKALRAALAAQPEPLFEGPTHHLTRLDAWNVSSWPEGDIVIYSAAAGSATPEEDT